MSSVIVKEILEDFIEYFLEIDLFHAERKLVSPIIHLIHDWWLSKLKNKGQEKQESELKQEILNLLDNGADVNEPELPIGGCNHGYTPILMASDAGANEVVKLLIERGANVNAVLTSGYECTSLGLAVIHDNKELMKILVENGANMGPRSLVTSMSLHKACKSDVPEIVETLIKNVADVNNYYCDYYGNPHYGHHALTLLHTTICYATSIKIVDLLVQYGADVEKQSEGGQTALLMALFEDQYEMAKVLIENGANVNFINFNSDGQSPLHLAATKNDPSLTKMLIDHGAEINTKNIHGHNALQLSLDFQKHENFKLIMFMNH